MEAICSCCAGLDVHKKTVVACVRQLQPDGRMDQHVRTSGTMTDELLERADRPAGHGIVRVALGSTGVFWGPVVDLLEAGFTPVVVNARHIKQVPGRETDVKDCRWIARLLEHGLLRPGFVPPRPIRELRDLTRQRTRLIRQRATQADRLRKVPEDADIKPAGVATDILGASGRSMVGALIAGESDPARMAELARRRMRAEIPLPVRALTGRVTDRHRYQPQVLMEQVEHLDGRIARIDGRIQEVTAPWAAEVARLATIPRVNRQAAEVLIAEVGVDMTASPTAGHPWSWAGMSPGNNRGAGKRYSGRTTKNDAWPRSVLVQAAWAAGHTEETRPGLTYRRLARRIGKKRAAVAVGRKILKLVDERLTHRTDYQERSPADQSA